MRWLGDIHPRYIICIGLKLCCFRICFMDPLLIRYMYVCMYVCILFPSKIGFKSWEESETISWRSYAENGWTVCPKVEFPLWYKIFDIYNDLKKTFLYFCSKEPISAALWDMQLVWCHSLWPELLAITSSWAILGPYWEKFCTCKRDHN